MITRGQRSLRIGNASAFYGDRFSAMREMLEGGPLDVLTGDYLAELTMLILGRAKQKGPEGGYATTFLQQMEECLALAIERRVVIVANAGGLDPSGLATALRTLAKRVGVDARVAHVEGDDLVARAGELGLGAPLTANAYLGAFGIAECLRGGANVVVTGRVTDASLVVGPAIAHFDWARDAWDALAGATVAGHVLECGAQATGGNYAFFTEHDVRRPGFPLAEIFEDGSCVVTKHEGTSGVVNAGTVTAQLLYEIGGARYAGPDVTTRFDTIRIEDEGHDRVRLHGTVGEPPPASFKVSLNHLGGYRNEVGFWLTGLDLEAKAALVERQLEDAIAAHRPSEMRWSFARTDRPDADTEAAASALLRCTVKDPDPNRVGRAFSKAAVELAVASYPGFHLASPPLDASPYGIYTPAYVEASLVPHVAVLPDGTLCAIAPSATTKPLVEIDTPTLPPPLADGPTRRVPLGRIAGARSGDKGGNANVGVWARTDDAWRFLVHALDVDALARLLPEAAACPVTRHVFPNLRAINFILEGFLGEGVASSTRFDPQAKAVGEWLRSRLFDVPESLLL